MTAKLHNFISFITIMKTFIKFILICWCTVGVAWIIATRTSWWQDYVNNILPQDLTTIKWGILTALDATGTVALTGTTVDTGEEMVISDTGAIIVDGRTLNQRLEYYKKNKEKLWKE